MVRFFRVFVFSCFRDIFLLGFVVFGWGMKRRKNVKEFTQIGNVISNVLQSYRHEADEGLAQIWNLWDRAVGENIAKNARPEAFKGKLLLVNVTSSAWAHELQFLKSDIIAKVNEVLGKALVEEIKFKVGPV